MDRKENKIVPYSEFKSNGAVLLKIYVPTGLKKTVISP